MTKRSCFSLIYKHSRRRAVIVVVEGAIGADDTTAIAEFIIDHALDVRTIIVGGAGPARAQAEVDQAAVLDTGVQAGVTGTIAGIGLSNTSDSPRRLMNHIYQAVTFR